ncbi:MAG: hypothetical protein ABF289_05240 [Clostridiales bacterium]
MIIKYKNELKKITEDIFKIANNFNKEYKNMIEKENKYELDKRIISTTQFSNILRNMNNISCVEEFKLFIRYQESRDKKKKIKWAMELADKKTIAECLIDSINKIIELVDREKSLFENEIDKERLKLECIEKMLGYCYWNVYVEKSALNK